MKFLRIFRKKLLSGLMWNGLSAFSLQGSNIAASWALTYLLGIETFGAYSLIVITVMMVSNFAQFGCGFVATKLVAENINSNPECVKSTINLCKWLTGITGVVATSVLFVASDILSANILNHPELGVELKIAALSILFQVSITYQTGALQGFSAFKDIAKGNVMSGLINLICLITGGKLAGLQGALAGFTLATMLRALICWISLRVLCARHGLSGNATIKKDDLRHLWQLALPAGLAGLVAVPSLWFVNLQMSNLPNGLVIVGIFAVATQIRQAALQVPILLNAVTFTVLSRAKGAGSEYKKIFTVNLWINLIFGIVISLLIGFMAEYILSLWRISSLEGIHTLRILAVSIIPELMAISAYQLVQSHGKMWASLFQIAVPRDVAYLCIAVYFMPVFGILAAGISYLLAQLIGLASTFLIIFRIRSI